MDFKIAVLAGDGIGPEISVQGVEVMSAVSLWDWMPGHLSRRLH